jgi:hypothetical protein
MAGVRLCAALDGTEERVPPSAEVLTRYTPGGISSRPPPECRTGSVRGAAFDGGASGSRSTVAVADRRRAVESRLHVDTREPRELTLGPRPRRAAASYCTRSPVSGASEVAALALEWQGALRGLRGALLGGRRPRGRREHADLRRSWMPARVDVDVARRFVTFAETPRVLFSTCSNEVSRSACSPCWRFAASSATCSAPAP